MSNTHHTAIAPNTNDLAVMITTDCRFNGRARFEAPPMYTIPAFVEDKLSAETTTDVRFTGRARVEAPTGYTIPSFVG